jgi:hypothetical protein
MVRGGGRAVVSRYRHELASVRIDTVWLLKIAKRWAKNNHPTGSTNLSGRSKQGMNFVPETGQFHY